LSYQVENATETGTPFHLTGPVSAPPKVAQVDLVNGASVWYTIIREWPQALPEAPGS
jgi:hypothetical protein